MVLPNDKMFFTVSSKRNGVLCREEFATFASAAGHAGALTGIRLINVEFYQVDDANGGRSSISGTLYIYGKNNVRRACNEYLIKQVMKRG